MSTTMDEQVAAEQADHEAEHDAEFDGEAAPVVTEEETPQEPKPPKLLQEPLPGDWSTVSNTFGGDDPTDSEIRLLGGRMPIDGSFEKGTELQLLVTVRVTGVLGQDVLDDWGNTKRTIRRHMARMVDVRRVNR